MDRETIISRIKKLFELSSSPNANESAAAMRMAREMMESYGVTESDIEFADITETEIGGKRRPPNWEVGLILLISRFYNVEVVISYIPGDSRYKFIGLSGSVEIAVYTYTVLFRQIGRARRIYIHQNLRWVDKHTKTTRANAYCDGWILGVSDGILFAPNKRVKALIEGYKSNNLKISQKEYSAKKYNADPCDIRSGYERGKQETLNLGLGGEERRMIS